MKTPHIKASELVPILAKMKLSNINAKITIETDKDTLECESISSACPASISTSKHRKISSNSDYSIAIKDIRISRYITYKFDIGDNVYIFPTNALWVVKDFVLVEGRILWYYVSVDDEEPQVYLWQEIILYPIKILKDAQSSTTNVSVRRNRFQKWDSYFSSDKQ